MDALGPPPVLPLGLKLAATAHAVRRAFDADLAAADGSLPVWLVLLNIKIAGEIKQRDLAGAVGLSEATLTHHLSGLEADGLVQRQRDPANRRVQLVALTSAGEERFLALREAALAFDSRLRTGVTTEEQAQLGSLLDRLVNNVAPADGDAAPWEGLAQ